MEKNVSSGDSEVDIEVKHIDAQVESPRLEEIDPVGEKKLVRKLDLILLPMFGLIYCVNFIDRTAVGNAKIAGLEADLGMKGLDFNTALTVFYIFFTVIEVPSNLVLRQVGSIWVAYLVIAFGVAALGSAFIKTYAQMLVTRAILGIAEGGTLSGLVYTLARFYRRKELILRMGLFLGLAPNLAGSFGGLLASGLLSIRDFNSIQRWRKIFFVEGIITIAIGLCLLFIIPEDPRTTRILNESERAIAIARINADAAVKVDGVKEKVTLKLILRSFNIWTWVCSMGFLLINISFQGLSLFLPTVVDSLGHFTVVHAQLRTVPCYFVAAVWSIIICYMSWHMNSRGIAIIVCMLLQIIGYAMAIGTKNSHARYAACFFSLMGAQPCGFLVMHTFFLVLFLPLTAIGAQFLTWGADNAAPDTMRAVVTAAVPGIGALGAIIAVWTYLPDDAPDFHQGNSINLAAAIAVIVLTGVGMLYLRRENKKRDQGGRDYRLEGKTKEEIKELGYRHPNFRYQL